MSIVYDYLKQIHDQKETKKLEPVVSSAPIKTAFSPKVKIVVLVLLVLGLGVGFSFLFLSSMNIAVKASRMPLRTSALPAEMPDFNFLLEGIIYNPSKPFAIIDGKMYEKGGKVGNFEIMQITPDTVLLKDLKDNTTHTARL